MVVNNPVLPVIVAPETRVVNTPDAKFAVVPVVVVPVKEVKLPVVAATVVPVNVVPETCVVNTPDTKVAVVPVVVAPVKEVKFPVVAVTVVPVNVVPLNVPVMVTPEANTPEPKTLRLPDTVKLF